jgi:hypothetical protein
LTAQLREYKVICLVQSGAETQVWSGEFMKCRIRCAFALTLAFMLVANAWAQWSSDPSKNLALADKVGSDQVQPKVRPLPTGGWYVSWFAPPVGYSV